MSKADAKKSLTLALSAPWHRYPRRFERLVGHGFAAGYSPCPDRLELLPAHLKIFFDHDVPVCHHAFFPEYEFGPEDSRKEVSAMNG
ncbi:MAG: hypothetical protein PVJ61_07790 [Dehalococcoidia bacterium]|jgi:hypothetical protein